MQNIAVILAGGTGTRFGGNTPKQMVYLNEQLIIMHTINAFVKSAKINRIVVVCHTDILRAVTDLVSDISEKPIDVIQGGKNTRLDSTHMAVQFLHNICDDEDKVLFHDSVRPLVSQQIIQDCIYGLDPHDAICVGLPATDTLMCVQGGGIDHVPDRSEYMHMQTPQGFRYHIIRDAHTTYDPHTDISYTDDCGYMMAKLPHVQVGIVLGDKTNIKITTPSDLAIAQNILIAIAQNILEIS